MRYKLYTDGGCRDKIGGWGYVITADDKTILKQESGREIDCKRTMDEEQAIKDFHEILMKHAGPIQRAVFGAGMEEGKKYTIFITLKIF